MVMRQGSDKWEALDPFCFVEPIPAETYLLENGFEQEEESYKGMKPLVGRLAYPNKKLIEQGAKEGDMIAFQQDSEHEYKIKGKLYYKMRTNDILGVI
jgi:co-chaperonin GroES (HSP10)